MFPKRSKMDIMDPIARNVRKQAGVSFSFVNRRRQKRPFERNPSLVRRGRFDAFSAFSAGDSAVHVFTRQFLIEYQALTDAY